MIARAFSSATAAFVVTSGLLLVMQILIATGQEIIGEPRAKHVLGLIKVRKEEEVVTRETLPTRPIKPPVPPPTEPMGSSPESGRGVRVYSPPPTPPSAGKATLGINYGDGPLFTIVNVSPNYPSVALARGLEGTVLVKFDVTTEGQVVNVVVVETSNSIFNKAAITAAYRFKYKPKTVDGIPYETLGLRKQFRFELDE